MGHQITLNLCRIDEIGHAKPRCHIALIRVQINANNLICTGHAQALDHVQANAPQTKHNRPAANFNLGSVHHRAKARGDPAANVTNFIKWRIRINFGQRNFRQDRVVGKSRAPHIMQYWGAIEHRKPAGAIGHHSTALGFANGLTQVGFRVQTIFTGSTFRRVKRDHMIPRLQTGHTRAAFQNHAGPFMA